jgi:hypothetical protein
MIGSKALIKLWRDRLFAPRNLLREKHDRQQRAIDRVIAQSDVFAPSVIIEDRFTDFEDGATYSTTKPPSEADRIWKAATRGLVSLGRIDTIDGE